MKMLRVLLLIGGALAVASPRVAARSPIVVAASSSPADPPWAAPLAAPTAPWHVLYRRAGPINDRAVDLRAVGDLMPGRAISDVARDRGVGYPLAQLGALLDGDLAVGNLESPLTDRRDELRSGPYRVPASPLFAPALADAGFDALALANNHALDAGPAGLHTSIDLLASASIKAVGAGRDSVAARSPVIIEARGRRIALLAFNDVPDPDDQPDEGLSWSRAWLDDPALESVARAREQADSVVVLVHWGREYTPAPTDRQRAWGRRLVAAGADLVLGTHPHVLQPIERVATARRSGIIAYSLGNALFDQPWSAATNTGAVLRIWLDRSGVAQMAAAPITVERGQIRLLAPDHVDARSALAILGSGLLTPGMQAWRWDGAVAHAIDVPRNLSLPERPRRLPIDLRGDGQPLLATLDERGMVEVRERLTPESAALWHNEGPEWRVTRVDAGDPNDDGRLELALLLWKPDEAGRLRSHPFLVGWRGGRYRVVWGGSATREPVQDLAIGDLDGDGYDELVVLEGGSDPGDPGDHVSVWRWHSWGFELRWRSAAGRWSDLTLHDLDGDGRPELLARVVMP